MKTIKLDNISCVRGGMPLFEGLTCDLNAGQVLRLTGPNGCGKSSLLKIISGAIEPSFGSVTRAPLQDIMFLDHKPIVKMALNTHENLSFWAAVHGTQSRLDMAIESLGLQSLLFTPVQILSSGQKKRVQLALLHLKRAWLWLLDEPLLSLDDRYKSRLGHMVMEHIKQGGAVIYASHEPMAHVMETTLNLMNFKKDRDDLFHAA